MNLLRLFHHLPLLSSFHFLILLLPLPRSSILILLPSHCLLPRSSSSVAPFPSAPLQILKEKKQFEDRVGEIQVALAEEEDKAKQLSKLKVKHEAIIADVEER